MGRYDTNLYYDGTARYDEPETPNDPMSQNLISQVMTDVQRDAMITDLSSFDTKFTNYKTSLTPEAIRHLAKLLAADIALLELALTYAQQNPTAIPGNISVTELANDIALAKQIAQVNAKAEQEANQTKSSLTAVLSDGYATARLIYRTAQAQGRTPQTIGFLDAFGGRFAHSAPSAPTPPPGP